MLWVILKIISSVFGVIKGLFCSGRRSLAFLSSLPGSIFLLVLFSGLFTSLEPILTTCFIKQILIFKLISSYRMKVDWSAHIINANKITCDCEPSHSSFFHGHRLQMFAWLCTYYASTFFPLLFLSQQWAVSECSQLPFPTEVSGQ